MKVPTTAIVASVVILALCVCSDASRAATWGAVHHIEFEKAELPENLYSKFTGNTANSVLQYCLPAGYSKSKDYPLIVYVPGFHGHPGGNIENAKDIADGYECVVVSLPLFKANIDRSEVGQGVVVGFADYPVLSNAYKIMFQRFYQEVPNIDRSQSAMVGFSNGAITIAVLITSHDRYILERFRSFCLVDHGMFHLTDLHKDPTRDRRFLILVGETGDYGELKQRSARLVEDSFQPLGIRVETRILANTGHELTAACKKDIGAWAFQ